MALDAISADNRALSGQGLALGTASAASRLPFGAGKAVLDGKQREFSRVLGRVNPAIQAAELGTETNSAKAKRRQAAEDMVAISLVQPILKSVRENNNAAAPFGPGPAEKQFGVFMDAAWARSMVKSGNFQLVNSVERWLGGNREPLAPASTQAPAAAATNNAAAPRGPSTRFICRASHPGTFKNARGTATRTPRTLSDGGSGAGIVADTETPTGAVAPTGALETSRQRPPWTRANAWWRWRLRGHIRRTR